MKDSATTPETSTSATESYVINSAFSVSASPASASKSVGQSQTYTATVSGGTTPYSYQWYNDTTGTPVAISGATASSLTVTMESATGKYTYFVRSTDSATTPETAQSNNVTLNPQPSLSISPNPAAYGTYVTITATCPISSDGCAIDYPSLGTPIATGNGTVSYTWNTVKEGIGTFSSFYSIDTSKDSNSVAQSLAVYVPINIYHANATSSEIENTLTPLGLYLIPQCANNSTSLSLGYCIGNMAYSTSTALSGNIYVFGNITIDSGVTLTENGFYMYATNTFDNLGTIKGGNNPNAPGGAANSGGTSITTSYAGSGGGGGAAGGAGGSTLVAGGSSGSAGSTPSAPTMSQSLATDMFNSVPKYLSSASGGGGGNTGGAGGEGVFGVVIGGNSVIAGTINVTGNAGDTTSSSGAGGGGGAGAGAILITYSTSYTAGTYLDVGGVGGSGGGGSFYSGGAGSGGQVITYQHLIEPALQSQSYYYPLKYNASTASNAINFNVSITDLSAGSKAYQASNQSFSYLPSQPVGYLLSFKEQQGTQKVYLNTTFTLSLADIGSALTFNSYNDSCIQYLPCLAETPTWNAKPSSWSIIPANEPLSNQHTANTTAGAQFDSPNQQVSFANAIKLSYPFTSFYLNLTANPLVANAITALAYNPKNATSTPPAPTTRLLYSIFSYNEQSKIPLNTITILTASMFMNNYTVPLSVTTPSSNAIHIYIPESNYQNPSILLLNQTATTTAVGFLPKINNLFNVVEQTSPQVLDIYLASTSNASAYAMTVYACNNYAYNYFLQIQNGPNGAQFQSQQYKMAQIPFSVPLLNGYPYQFLVYSASGKLVYTSAVASWVSPITLYAPCATAVNVTPIVYPIINATCTWANYPINQLNVTCTGRGTSVSIKNWTILWQNQTSLISTQTLGVTSINSPTFSANFLFPSNHTQWLVKMTAFYGDPNNQTFLQTINPVPSPILPVDLALVAIGFILVAVVLAYFNIALGIIIEIFALAIGSITGIIVISASATIALIIIGVIILVGDLVLHGGHH